MIWVLAVIVGIAGGLYVGWKRGYEDQVRELWQKCKELLQKCKFWEKEVGDGYSLEYQSPVKANEDPVEPMAKTISEGMAEVEKDEKPEVFDLNTFEEEKK
jgi:hypothetical protein